MLFTFFFAMAKESLKEAVLELEFLLDTFSYQSKTCRILDVWQCF